MVGPFRGFDSTTGALVLGQRAPGSPWALRPWSYEVREANQA